jgi:hypothetical protein
MSGRRLGPDGFSLTLSLSKGEQKAFFNEPVARFQLR